MQNQKKNKRKSRPVNEEEINEDFQHKKPKKNNQQNNKQVDPDLDDNNEGENYQTFNDEDDIESYVVYSKDQTEGNDGNDENNENNEKNENNDGENNDMMIETDENDNDEEHLLLDGQEIHFEEGNIKDENDDEDDEDDENVKVWNPKEEPLQEGDALEFDSTAYDMLHFMTVDWPCLSFDVLTDNLGVQRKRFPHTLYLVAGSQADIPENNEILIMKMSDLHRTKYDNTLDSGSDSNSDDMDNDPVLEYKSIPHPSGGINRIRAMPQQTNIVASFSDNREVSIWDFQKYIGALDTPPKQGLPKKPKPLYTFTGHPDEGFAIDWSPKLAGRLVTGDCKKNIYLWNPNSTTWDVDLIPFVGHEASVEDLKWSPTEQDVFCSSSVDRTVKFWDIRGKKKPVANINAHNSDVNVISWNNSKTFLLVSGSDDGSFKVWDLRTLKEGKESVLFSFAYHEAAITSITWDPNDDSALALSSEDNSVTFWDLSVTGENENEDYPPQLLFIHRGQTHIKEVHYHHQIPGVVVSTSLDGFNVLKPSNI